MMFICGPRDGLLMRITHAADDALYMVHRTGC